MRRLIISNTHFQTIVAIQLKLTLFAEDQVTLIISDHSRRSEKVADELKKINIFEDVKYIKTREIIDSYNKKQDYIDFFMNSFGKSLFSIFYVDELKNKNFDELIVYNLGYDIFDLHCFLIEFNRKIGVSRFEEGILSYDLREVETKKLHLSTFLRSMRGRRSLYNSRRNFYCFFPKIYRGKYMPIKIPEINRNGECVEILKKIFGYHIEDNMYTQKYIFFTSVYDFEGGKPIGEFELVKRIADLVGMDNLLVKIHPRDTRTIYKEYGFHIDPNSSIPWEVIQLCNDFSEKVFLTATSGSVMAGSFMSNKPVKTWYLFELCDISDNYAINTVNEIKRILSDESIKENLLCVKIAKTLNDIYE